MSSVKVYLADHCNRPVYPGETISGRVECNFSEQKNLRAVRIKFRGRAKCEWTESRTTGSGKSRRTHSVRYWAEEAYFDAEYNLVHGNDDFSLPAGKHVYPFSYVLPPQMPSSFEGSYGNVRYYVKAVVDRPWKLDYEDKLQLEVISPLDLNYVNGAREPVAISVDKTFCSCWCNDTGALTFNISLPCSGFVPGQEVDIGAYVQNMSNVSAENVKFKIVKEIEYITHYPSTHRRYGGDLVSECMDGGIGAHGEKSWTSKLSIPLTSSFPNMIPCSIINITYVLKAKVIVPCPHSNLSNDVPLFIGSVPISGVSTTFPQGPPPTPQPALLPPSDALTFEFIDGTSRPNASNTHFPNSTSPSYPGVAAPSAGDAPYPSGPSASAPYPSSGPSGGSYPPAPYPGGGVPYPAASKAPYPPSSDAGPSAPLAPGESDPYFSTEAAPPSYSEAENLLEKK